MNKKKLGKVTGVATASFLIAGTTAFTAFAAMPSGTAVIGTKSYDLNYVNDPANQEEITAAMVAADFKVYVKDFAGNWIVNETEAPLTDLSVIPAVDYKAADGKITKYDAKDGNVTAPVSDVLKVESVSAVNLKQIKVVFNNAVDETSAELGSNYTIYDNGSVTAYAGTKTATLQADGKTVLITLGAASAAAGDQLTNLGNVKVVISKAVKDANGVALTADYTASAIAVSEIARPTVTSIKQTAPNKLRVSFSTPIKDLSTGLTIDTANFSVDAGSYIVTAATPSVEGNYVDLQLGGSLTNGNHTLKVNPLVASDLASFAGFLVSTGTEVPFTVTNDTIAPTAIIKSVTQSTVVFKFNKPVNNAQDSNIAYRHSINGTTYQVLGNNANVSVSTDRTEVTVNFAAAGFPIPTGSSIPLFISYVSTTSGSTLITDDFNNNFAATSIATTVVADVVKPTATAKIVADSNTQIDVTYSKAVVGATTPANYTLKDSLGVAVPFTITNPSTNVYRLTSAALSGNYTLTIANVKDTALVANVMDTYTTTINVADIIKPFITLADGATSGTTLYSQADNKHVRIYFSEAMNASDLATLSFYQNVADSYANPTVATPAADGKSVYLTFDNNVVNTQGVVVGQLRDLVGNKISALSTTLTTLTSTPTVGLNTLVTKNVVAINPTTIKVYLNDLLSSLDANEFQVRKDGSTWVKPATVAVDNTSGKSVLTLTLNAADALGLDAASAQVQTGSTLTAQAATVNTKNLYGATVNVTPTSISDTIVPEIVASASNPIQVLDADSNGKIDHIVLTFKEAIAAGTVSSDKFTVSGHTVLDAYAATGAPTAATARTGATVADSTTVFLRVNETTATGGDLTSLPSVTVSTGLTDVAGNAYAGLSTATASVDGLAALTNVATTGDLAQLGIIAGTTDYQLKGSITLATKPTATSSLFLTLDGGVTFIKVGSVAATTGIVTETANAIPAAKYIAGATPQYILVDDTTGKISAISVADGAVPVALANATLTSTGNVTVTTAPYTYVDLADTSDDTLAIAASAFAENGTITTTGFATDLTDVTVNTTSGLAATSVGDNTDSATPYSATIRFTNAAGNTSAATTLTINDN